MVQLAALLRLARLLPLAYYQLSLLLLPRHDITLSLFTIPRGEMATGSLGNNKILYFHPRICLGRLSLPMAPDLWDPAHLRTLYSNNNKNRT